MLIAPAAFETAQKRFGGGPRIARWAKPAGSSEGGGIADAVHSELKVRDDSSGEVVTLYVASEMPFDRLKLAMITALEQEGDPSQFRVYDDKDDADTQSYDDAAQEAAVYDRAVTLFDLAWLPVRRATSASLVMRLCTGGRR